MAIRISDQTAASSSSNAQKAASEMHRAQLRSIQFGWSDRTKIQTIRKSAKLKLRRRRLAKMVKQRPHQRDADRRQIVRHVKSKWIGTV